MKKDLQMSSGDEISMQSLNLSKIDKLLSSQKKLTNQYMTIIY